MSGLAVKVGTRGQRAEAAPPALPRAAWSRRVEAASLQPPQALLAEAKRNFRALRDPAMVWQLAQEIAQTRAPELTLAYRNVVMVAAGYKRKRGADGRERLTRRACVVFIVRRKWAAAATDEADRQHLPRQLLTWASIDGERRVFAVPTDVQHEQAMFRTVPRAAAAVWTDATEPPEFGTLTCAVDVAMPTSTERYLMSAQHVLSPAPDAGAKALRADTAFRPFDGAGKPLDSPTVCFATDFGGQIRADENPDRPSFDVQLARVGSEPAARAALSRLALWAQEPLLTGWNRLAQLNAEQLFELLVSDNHPQAASPSRPRMLAKVAMQSPSAHGISYQLTVAGSKQHRLVFHEELIAFEVTGDRVPLDGDSGSAVVARRGGDRFTLVGMYIGGDGRNAYAIPAWRLFNPKNYWNLPDRAELRPASW